MEIVGALDVHRRQITTKVLDLRSGEVRYGQVRPAARGPVRDWLSRFAGLDAHFALEATTGWRFIVEELVRAGLSAHLADPAETAARRGRKRRAKTDRADCDLLLELLLAERLPEAWIPPRQIAELRILVRTRLALMVERNGWQRRLHAQLFQQGLPPGLELWRPSGRAALLEARLSPAGQTQAAVGVRVIELLEAELAPLERTLRAIARRQPGCRALSERLYGVGELTSSAIVAELGDVRRFASSDDAVRHTGLDITVWESDTKRAPGRLSRQGPEVLRWALFEAAQSAARPGSPDHAYYRQVRARHDHPRACLSVARKLCRRAHHILRELGDEALAPVEGLLPASEEVAQAA